MLSIVLTTPCTLFQHGEIQSLNDLPCIVTVAKLGLDNYCLGEGFGQLTSKTSLHSTVI